MISYNESPSIDLLMPKTKNQGINPKTKSGCVSCGLDIISPGITREDIMNSPSYQLLMPKTIIDFSSSYQDHSFHINTNEHTKNRIKKRFNEINISKLPAFQIEVILPRIIQVGNCNYDISEPYTARLFNVTLYKKYQNIENQNPKEQVIIYNVYDLSSHGYYKYVKLSVGPDTILYFSITIEGPCDDCCKSLIKIAEPPFQVIKYAVKFFYSQPEDPNYGNQYFDDCTFVLPKSIIANSNNCVECSRTKIDIDDPSPREIIPYPII